jgi:glycyl-tRNA synthetase
LVPPGKLEALQTAFSVFIALIVVGFVAFLMQAFCEIRGVVPPMLGASHWLPPRLHDVVARPFMFTDAIPSVQSYASVATENIKDSATHIPSAEEMKDTIVQDLLGNLEDTTSQLAQKLSHLVAANTGQETTKAIIVRDMGMGEVSTEVRPDSELVKDETIKKWEELSELQKRGWKQKLKDAGHWVESQGEGVLKGVLFSELAGAVGDLVRGA